MRLEDGRLRFTVYVDRASVEVFADGGARTITDQVFPRRPVPTTVSAWADGGTAWVERVTATPLDAAHG